MYYRQRTSAEYWNTNHDHYHFSSTVGINYFPMFMTWKDEKEDIDCFTRNFKSMNRELRY